jgi:hypothetical protein
MTTFLNQDLARELIFGAITHLKDWAIPTAERFRNAALTGGFAISPLLDISDGNAALFLQGMIQTTIREGRMIDFGFIPNKIHQDDSCKYRYAYEMGELPHPYETWLGVSKWEGGMCGYHVCPTPHAPERTLVIELYGITLPNGEDLVIVYDIVSIQTLGIDNTVVSPYAIAGGISETEDQMRARGANSLDPLVTMLGLLSNASVPIIPHSEPLRLNLARAKKGKHPIPAHTEVDVRDYVANYASHVPAGKIHQGGTHASPIPHWRRSHLRTLPSGKRVPVRSSKVNWRDTEELHRLFYRLR